MPSPACACAGHKSDLTSAALTFVISFRLVGYLFESHAQHTVYFVSRDPVKLDHDVAGCRRMG
jgi:hypothetical protein